MTEGELYQKQVETCKQVQNMINELYISKDKIREKIKELEKLYIEEMKPYQTEYGLNVSLLSKKEKEQVINKRNTFIIQMGTLKELLKED